MSHRANGGSTQVSAIAPQGATFGRERSERGAPGGALLDLHEGIGDPQGCKRWPEGLRLLNETTGELVPGRCRATNLCRYCQTLYVVETVEMLTLDAVEYAPTLWVVLTAREHLTRAECREHLRQLRRSLRKRWPGVEWFVQVEFQRRGALHLNLLIKGVPVEHLQQLHAQLVERWCARVDALPVGQWSGVVQDGEGVVKYLAKMLAHGLKVEQRPPLGWRGHRTSQTRGYLVRPASVMRLEARASLAAKRRLWRSFAEAVELAGGGTPTADLVESVYEQRESQELAAVWSLRHVNPSLALRDVGGQTRPGSLTRDQPGENRGGGALPQGHPPGLPPRSQLLRAPDAADAHPGST